MDDEGVLTFDKILERVEYNCTKDSNLKRTESIENDLKKRVDKIRSPPLALPAHENEDNFVDLTEEARELKKIIIPSNIIDIYTRLQVLLGLKLSGHNNTQREARNLIDQ